MKIILFIVLILICLFLFGEFVLDMLAGAFAILAGAAGAGVSSVFRRFSRKKQQPDKKE